MESVDGSCACRAVVGPIGFTTTTKVFELRPGCQWLPTMHGPDGTDYRNDITFTAVVEPERIEYDHGPNPLFYVTVTFSDAGNSITKWSTRMPFATAAERDRTVEKFGAVEVPKQTRGRLEQYLGDCVAAQN